MSVEHPRIVQVTGFYPPHLGGVELVAQALAEHLQQAGREVEVLTTDVGATGVARDRNERGVRVRRHRAAYVAHTPLSPGLLVGLLRQPRGTIVHAHVAQAALVELVALACGARGLTWVAHVHLDVDASGRLGRLLPLWKRWVLGPALRRADRVITLTGEMGEVLVHDRGVDRSRLVVLRNGVDARFFEAGLEERPDRGAPVLRVLFAGRLAAQKNVARLLAAVELATAPIELVLVGEGEQRAELQDLARGSRLAAPITFTGALPRDALLDQMRQADVLVLPSDREGMPLVALEAMAAGLPVLATDVPGNRELLAGCGGLVGADAGSLAAALDLFAADRPGRVAMAARQRAVVAHHRWPLIAAELGELYDEVAS